MNLSSQPLWFVILSLGISGSNRCRRCQRDKRTFQEAFRETEVACGILFSPETRSAQESPFRDAWEPITKSFARAPTYRKVTNEYEEQVKRAEIEFRDAVNLAQIYLNKE